MDKIVYTPQEDSLLYAVINALSQSTLLPDVFPTTTVKKNVSVISISIQDVLEDAVVKLKKNIHDKDNIPDEICQLFNISIIIKDLTNDKTYKYQTDHYDKHITLYRVIDNYYITKN